MKNYLFPLIDLVVSGLAAHTSTQILMLQGNLFPLPHIMITIGLFFMIRKMRSLEAMDARIKEITRPIKF